MNGGAYGRELSDVVVSATAIDRSGKQHNLAAKTSASATVTATCRKTGSSPQPSCADILATMRKSATACTKYPRRGRKASRGADRRIDLRQSAG